MHDQDQTQISSQLSDEDNIKFVCPNCGEIARDDVVFLCNVCSHEELIYQDGVYMCPACLAPGENFQCMKCDSKEVKMEKKSPSKASKTRRSTV